MNFNDTINKVSNNKSFRAFTLGNDEKATALKERFATFVLEWRRTVARITNGRPDDPNLDFSYQEFQRAKMGKLAVENGRSLINIP